MNSILSKQLPGYANSISGNETGYARSNKGNETMFSNEIINRVFDYDRASSIAMSMMASYMKNMEIEKIKTSIEEFEEIYEKFYSLAKKISDKIEAGESLRNKNMQIDNAKCLPASIHSQGSSLSRPSMKATSR